MTRNGWFLAAVLLSWVLPRAAAASFLGYVEVMQPFSTDGGWEIHPVLYGTFEYGPGQAASYTCRANAVLLEGSIQNCNEASRAGLETRVESTERVVDGESSLDSLRVIFDVTRALKQKKEYGNSLGELIDYTGRCLLLNTARTAMKPSVIEVRVIGPPEYHSIAGFYRIDSTGTPEEKPRLVRVDR